MTSKNQVSKRRKSAAEYKERRVPAIEIRQGPHRVLYALALDGKELADIAAVARVRRDQGSAAILGYQRPEVLSHIAEIREYLESKDPMVPNAIVVAFNRTVRFEASDIQPVGQPYTRLGTLIIPVSDGGSDEDKPGWIVDGQQRVAAVREARIERFPVCVTAFITDSDHEQREQFILVNSTKPLPKGLIYELLPDTDARLPSGLQRRRFPAALLRRLNQDADSPLRGMIHTTTNPTGVIKDNSVLKMLENSLSEGALYQFRDPRSGRGNERAMLAVLKSYWAAARYVFADAWGQPPRRSRLMHGAGIVSMGFVMDAILDEFPAQYVPAEDEIRTRLAPLAKLAHWTSGAWQFGDGSTRKWNEIQNTPRDIQLLSGLLMQAYKRSARARSSSGVNQKARDRTAGSKRSRA